MILTLLIYIFSKWKNNTQTKNPNLILAGLKLIEMISIMNIEEFMLH